MEFSPKDFVLVCSVLSTIISSYYALKFKTQKNTEDNKTTADSFKEFKQFVHQELEEVKLSISELLKKEDAESKYLTRKEHKLTYENLNMKIDLILDAVKNKTK